MRVLVVSNSYQQNEFYRSLLRSVAEPHELRIINSLESSRTFITNEIIGQQKDLDVIVTDLILEDGDASGFCYDIRNNYFNTFSNSNFKVSSIPVILLSPGRYDMERYQMFGFNDVIDVSNDFEVHQLPNIIKYRVSEWRQKVYDDLEYLGLSSRFDYRKAHSINILKTRSENTFAISTDFVNGRKKIENNWFNTDFKSIENSILKFQKKLEYSCRFKNKHEEKKYHELFRKWPHLLLRSNYQKDYYYEPEFSSNDNYEDGIEPDFFLKPYYDNENQIDLLELKLPNENLIKTKKYHSTFLARMFLHFGQIKDYQDYLEDPYNEETITSTLGFKPRNINYNLLVGRTEDREANREIFEKRVRHFGLEDINVITYDDIMEVSVNYYNQLQELKI